VNPAEDGGFGVEAFGEIVRIGGPNAKGKQRVGIVSTGTEPLPTWDLPGTTPISNSAEDAFARPWRRAWLGGRSRRPARQHPVDRMRF